MYEHEHSKYIYTKPCSVCSCHITDLIGSLFDLMQYMSELVLKKWCLTLLVGIPTKMLKKSSDIGHDVRPGKYKKMLLDRRKSKLMDNPRKPQYVLYVLNCSFYLCKFI